MFSNKRIVVAPLHWGLGHATRCIPIIRDLCKNNTVAIASDGEALKLLQTEFPELDSFELPSYGIRYTFDSMIANMIIQGPGAIATIRKESKKANEIAENWNADILISDNRFGFRSDKTTNIYITHQLNIPANNPLIANIASRAHKRIINKFDQCWVPDYKGSKTLAGKMSQVNVKIPTTYLGPVSRLKKESLPITYDFAAILSGPEPQRTTFESILMNVFSEFSDKKFCLVRGTSAERKVHTDSINVDVFDLLNSEELGTIINSSNHIICRSGYTSIMDLIQLEKSALLVPTPGQYEQEYLAKRLDKTHNFNSITQNKLERYLKDLFNS